MRHRKRQTHTRDRVDGATSSQEGTCYKTPAELGFAAKPGSLRRCLKMSLLKVFFLDSRPNPVI